MNCAAGRYGRRIKSRSSPMGRVGRGQSETRPQGAGEWFGTAVERI